MSKFIKTICLLLVFLLSSCCQNSDKDNGLIIDCQHKMLFDDDEYMLGKPNCIALVDSILVIADSQTNPMLHLLNIKTGKPIGQYLSRGQGPDEYMAIGTLGRLNKNTLFFHDLNKRVFCYLVFPKTENGKIQIVEAFKCTEEAHNTMIPLTDASYMASGIYQKGRFCLLTDSGKTKDFWGTYPSRDEREKSVSNFIKSQAYMGQLSSSPANDKFVFHAAAADMLSFYKYENKEIRLIKDIQRSFPDYKYGKDIDEFLGTSRKKPITYLSACTTEQFVYLLYSGKTYMENQLKAFESNEIHVYDWNGERVKTLSLDIDIKEMVVSDDDSIMYAIADLPNPAVVKFKL